MLIGDKNGKTFIVKKRILTLSVCGVCVHVCFYMSRLMTKPTKWHVRPARTQISLGICPVWSESSLSAWRKPGSLATHWAHSEDTDQTGQMPRLIWVFTECTVILLILSRGGSCVYRKAPKNLDTRKNYCNYLNIWLIWIFHGVMHLNDADGMANSVEPDQTAPLGAVQSDLGLHCLLRPVCPKI